MSSSTNEDQEQRTTTSIEKSNEMTVEFLRARLLSERSVSKTARQRADELAKRVAELEEQLNFVSLQREKAEKATVDVLAILENRGINESLSEEFDSCSEEDNESPHNFKACNGMKESLTSRNMKLRKNEMEVYSSSEVESSPSTGRSLSWKSSKDSQHLIGKKKYMDSIRRRASFASSNSSSARRVGKSCRRIRRRDTRSLEELQNNDTEKSRDFSDGEPIALRENSGHDNGKNPVEGPTLGSSSENQKINGHYFGGRERDEEDMESALQHQAQLIGRYEDEEKAQREWEEKYRENNSGTQVDSYDLGNHSDITEERYDVKSPQLSSAAGASISNNQETKQEHSEELQDEKSNIGLIPCESEFSFPTSKDRKYQDSVRKQHEPTPQFSRAANNNHPSSLELAIVPQETSNSYGSVLDALQRAKFSLREKLNTSVSSETTKLDDFRIPTVSPAIFRLPTNEQFEATHRSDSVTVALPSFSRYRPEIANATLFSENAPYRHFNTPEIQPRLSEGPPPPSYIRPSVADSYPFLPDIMLRLPLSEERSSRSISSSESGLPPFVRLSSYDEQRVRPNMYR